MIGALLKPVATALELNLEGGLQLWETTALLEAARPAGLPPAEPATGVRSWAANQGLASYTPPPAPFPLAPTVPALLWWRKPPPPAALANLLAARYPTAHPLTLAACDPAGVLTAHRRLNLADLAGTSWPSGAYGLLALPPLSLDQRGADGLRWVITRLLGPGGCPWDVRQSHQDLRKALLEETHEVLEALDTGDIAGLSEELGDLLIAIFSHSEMARQAGHFDLETVFAQICSKLIRRHPHVFAQLSVEGEGQVLQNWEQIKAAERAEQGRVRASLLDGVPPSLPALATAQTLGHKAARAGFNWQVQAQIWAKLHEELDELAEAATSGDQAHMGEELGDTLFTLTRLADWLHLDAEAVLREANHKFRRRFAHLEAAAAHDGVALHEPQP